MSRELSKETSKKPKKEPIRLAKRLIELIKCSRSEAEKYIEGGWVLVDDEVVDLPQFKVSDQKVVLHAGATLDPIRPATIIFHMPEQFEADEPSAGAKLITPDTRAAGDRSGTRTLKRHFMRLLPTLPLEEGSTGLMVFTQDGRIASRLQKNDNKNEQEYIVQVEGDIAPDGLKQLNNMMKRNAWPLSVAKVSWQNEDRLRFVLKNVQAGQIEFMCGEVGLTVVAMNRIRIGRVPMSKLAAGQWRYLPEGKFF